MRTKDKLSHYHCRLYSFCFILILLLTGTHQIIAQQAPSRVDQMSDEQVIEFYRQAQSRGLSEAQIEQLAMSQGYTLTDIGKMRKRIAELRLQTNRTRSRGQTLSDTSNGRTLPGDLSRRFFF